VNFKKAPLLAEVDIRNSWLAFQAVGLKAPVKAVTMSNDTRVRSCILFQYFN
jgi:hypothetical protein